MGNDSERPLRRFLGGAAAIAAALSFAGCGNSEQVPSGTASPTTATSSLPTGIQNSGTAGIVVATGFDKSGAPTGVAAVFDHARDSQILIVIPSQGAVVGTNYAYTRYLDGKYIDSRTAKLGKPGKYFFFETTVKPNQQLVIGHFRYQVYVDRALLGAVEFDVR